MRRSASDADLADGERDDIGGEGDGLGVKVAAGQRFVGVGEDQRIVGHAVGLACQRRGGLAQDIERRAHHLRLAAQAIGVLHALVVRSDARRESRCPPSASRSAAAVSIWPRWPRKAWMRGSNGASDPRAASVDSAPLEQRGLEQTLRLEQRRQRVGGRELRAVEQREPLLRTERERREASVGESDFRRQAATLEKDLADPDHRRGHVGQRREIARRADRPLHGDDGRHAARQHRLPAAPAFPAARRRRPAPGSPSFRAIISRTIGLGAASPTPAACESTMLRCSLGEVRLGDANARELAEAGIHAIDRFAPAHDARDRRGARVDPRPAGGIEDRAGRRDRSPRQSARRRAPGLRRMSVIGPSRRGRAAD